MSGLKVTRLAPEERLAVAMDCLLLVLVQIGVPWSVARGLLPCPQILHLFIFSEYETINVVCIARASYSCVSEATDHVAEVGCCTFLVSSC